MPGIDELDFRLLHALVSPVHRDKLHQEPGDEPGDVQQQHSPVENESSEQKAVRLTNDFKNEKDVRWILEDINYYWELRDYHAKEGKAGGFGLHNSEPSVIDNLSDALTPGVEAHYARLRLGDKLSDLNSDIAAPRFRPTEPERLPNLRSQVEHAAHDYQSHLESLEKALAANTHLRGSEAARSVTEHLSSLSEALTHERERMPAK